MADEIPTVELEYSVAGRKVWMKERLPGEKAHRLPHMMSEYSGDTDVIVQMGVIAIDRWEFSGDPSKPRSYAQLDIFDELIPLGKALLTYIVARMERSKVIEESLKN